MAETIDIIVGGQTRSMTVPDALEMGKNRQESGDLYGAAEIYQQIHNADPNQMDALHMLGVISHRLGEHGLAADLIASALAMAPNFAEAHSNLGVVFFDQGRLDEAAECYRKAITLNLDYADAHNNLATMLLLSGNFGEGWQEFSWRWKIS